MFVCDFQKKFRETFSEKAQGMTEYAIILAVVAITAIAVLFAGSGEGFDNTMQGLYQKASDKTSDSVNRIGDGVTSNANP